MNPKNHKNDAKKKNLIATDSSNQVESRSNVDENIACTSMQNEVKLCILHHKEEKEMKKVFHIKIQVKKTKVDSLFNSILRVNLIKVGLVRNLGLEVHDHPSLYTLGWVKKDAKIKVMK
jgi:hypothetical protein